MTKFAVVSAALGLLIYAFFLCVSIRKFGLRRSYSSFAPYWKEEVKIHNVNLWSLVTIVSAILLAFGMIEVGSGSNFQFLGFLTPVYLVVVALTPEYQTNIGQRIAHLLFTYLCVIGFLLYLCFVLRLGTLLIAPAIVFLAIGFASQSLRVCGILWLEQVLFLTAFLVPLIPAA